MFSYNLYVISDEKTKNGAKCFIIFKYEFPLLMEDLISSKISPVCGIILFKKC